MALNESVNDRNGATKFVRSAPTRQAIVRDESTVEVRRGVQRSPAQLLLFFSAFTAVAVAVFLHYKRARQARLDAMKPSQEEAESRLDHYMAAHAKAHESAEKPLSLFRPNLLRLLNQRRKSMIPMRHSIPSL